MKNLGNRKKRVSDFFEKLVAQEKAIESIFKKEVVFKKLPGGATGSTPASGAGSSRFKS